MDWPEQEWHIWYTVTPKKHKNKNARPDMLSCAGYVGDVGLIPVLSMVTCCLPLKKKRERKTKRKEKRN